MVLVLGCGSAESDPGGSGGDAGGSPDSSTGTTAAFGATTGGATTSGGNGGDGGGDATTASTSTSGAGGGGGSNGVGTPCSWGADPACPDGLYCYAPGCAAGTCELIPSTETHEYDPVCDCSGYVHWNASVAARFGASVAHAGHCNFMDPQNPCDVAECPVGMYCNQYVGNGQNACPFALDETCWGLPQQCEPAGDPGAYACGSTECVLRCEIMKTGEPWVRRERPDVLAL